MTWSISTGNKSIHKDKIQSIEGQAQTAPEGVGEAYRDQLVIAKFAAAVLADVIGRDEDEVVISVTGHANPDHAPCEGWSDEFITITVSAKPKS